MVTGDLIEADALVIAEVIALVQLVPAAELGADGVPHELHQLHAVYGLVAIRPADVLIQIFPDLRLLEIARMRRQIDTGRSRFCAK